MTEDEQDDLVLSVTDNVFLLAAAMCNHKMAEGSDARDETYDRLCDRESKLHEALDKFFEACYNRP